MENKEQQTEPVVVDVKDSPKNSTTYLLPDGRYVRVHLKLLTTDDALATANEVEVRTSAYEVNKNGDFIVDEDGEPVMMPRQGIRIPLSQVHSGATLMKPGWVETDIAYDPKNPREDSADVRQLKNLPKNGKSGERVYIEGDKKTYSYTDGLYENVRRQQITTFTRANVLPATTTVDPSKIEALKP